MQKTKSQVQRILESVAVLRSRAHRIRVRIGELEARCAKQIGPYGIHPRGTGLTTEEVWDILCDERERLITQLEKLQQLEHLIQRRIDRLPNALWRKILRYRYLDGLSFAQVTLKLREDTGHSYSKVHLYRSHRTALEALEAEWNNL